MKKLSLIAAAFVAVTSFAYANVIRVAPTGIPSTIQGAVDVAVDGDVILVETGTYPSFVIRNKELTVVANTGANVKIDGAIRVGNLAATRTVVISGLANLGAPVSDPFAWWGLRVANCSGLVFVQDCSLTGTPPSSGPLVSGRASVLVENSAGVVLSNCVVAGGVPQIDSLGYGYAGPSPDGARVTNSTLALYDTPVRGGNAGAGYVDGIRGGDGIVVSASQVFASGGLFAGGNGGNGNDDGDGGNGGHGAVVQTGSALTSLGTASSGGSAGLAGVCNSPFGACPHNGSSGVAATVHAGATRTLLSGSARVLAAPALASEHQRVQLAFSGAPNDLLVRASGEHARFQLVTGAGAQIPLHDATYRKVTLGVLSGLGTFTDRIAVAELGNHVEARVLFLQGTHAESGTVVRLGTPRALIVLDRGL